MTTDEKLEKIWEQQTTFDDGLRHPILYERCRERCGEERGWRLYMRTVGGDILPAAIAYKGSPSLREAVDTAYAKLFPA